MAEAKVYRVRVNGGPTMRFLSVDELIAAEEEGRLTVSEAEPADGDRDAETGSASVAANAGERVYDPSARPIEDVIREITAQVPDEEWERLPPDLSEQHDHCIYGTPKR